MTGLEALHKIASKVELADNDDYWEVRNAHNIVEKELKVLEILKKKGDLSALIDAKNVDDFNWYLCCEDKEHEFTEEEFELLKEVLK